ncbi:MAG: YhbY family RNA-binding protein [Clostridia bacterium]|nr:YhbY family RNA-binding protein [Clostridia bacterium]
MITSKQRAFLRSLANPSEPIFQIGKGGVSDESIRVIGDALEARELVKIRTLETSPLSSREAAGLVSERTGADIVSVVGRNFVLYRRSVNKPKIVLP